MACYAVKRGLQYSPTGPPHVKSEALSQEAPRNHFLVFPLPCVGTVGKPLIIYASVILLLKQEHHYVLTEGVLKKSILVGHFYMQLLGSEKFSYMFRKWVCFDSFG